MMRKLEVNDIEDTDELKNAFSITVKGGEESTDNVVVVVVVVFVVVVVVVFAVVVADDDFVALFGCFCVMFIVYLPGQLAVELD